MNQSNRDALIQELITVAGAIAVIIISKKVMTPDFGNALKMRAALAVKKTADAQVEIWQKVAGNAATVYQKARA